MQVEDRLLELQSYKKFLSFCYGKTEENFHATPETN